MDIATLIGLTAGIAIIVTAIGSAADFHTYLNVPGLLIVFGGTAAAIFIKFPLKVSFASFWRGLKIAFSNPGENPLELIRTATRLSHVVRKRGKLALEDAPVKNTFFRKGTQLIADGHSVEFVRKVLTTEMDSTIERHQMAERVFRGIGDSAPAFGMIGTLVGLVQMLSHMDDPKSIGLGMAVALLTTLYGSLIANLFAIPIADKLHMRALADYNNRALIIEGVELVANAQHPRMIEEILLTFLPGHERGMVDYRMSRAMDADAAEKIL